MTNDHDRPANLAAHYLPWAVVTLCLLWLILLAWPVRPSGEFNLHEFATVPVSYRGRVKPVDSVARNTLMIISNEQTFKHEGERISAVQWLATVLGKPDQAEQFKVFRIDHPGVLAIFGFKPHERKLFSVSELLQRQKELAKQAHQVELVPRKQRNLFQLKLDELVTHIMIYSRLASQLHLVPPVTRHDDWTPIHMATEHVQRAGDAPVGAVAWAAMMRAYGRSDAKVFNETLAEYQQELHFRQPVAFKKARFETFFNRYAPFRRCMVIYVVAGLVVSLSWLSGSKALLRTATGLVSTALIVHTLGLMARIYLSGRPPVTNLYSSAVFIGWGILVLCLVVEYLHRNGIATLLGATAGFLTLLVAQALAGDGDTMAVLVAVLDTNFWLATHVVAVTIGYSATFLAGLIGIIYIFRGLLTRGLTVDENRRMGQMLYGVVCFAMLFSFVGTILGGIWADQSWGRFWGWDPKENGAVLIVLWNALILHARWGGLVRQRGVANLAVFGNIVTGWSYFGTNMLGVGLHSYGFIDSAAFWMFIFVASQLAIIAVGCIPLRHWRSFAGICEARA